jgi:hypothetical protein
MEQVNFTIFIIIITKMHINNDERAEINSNSCYLCEDPRRISL